MSLFQADDFEFSESLDSLLELAIAEDLGSGDVTTSALVPSDFQREAVIISREPLVVCGQALAARVFQAVDTHLVYQALVSDGEEITEGIEIGLVSGSYASILTAERTVLNFMQRLSGIASLTARLVSLVKGRDVSLLDTRKTTPGWRRLEKYAVKVGGGVNHRFGLYDACLIKNNHVDVLPGGAREAVELCRERYGATLKIEVEVRNRKELSDVLPAGPDAILLDNMSPEEVKASVEIIRAREGAIEQQDKSIFIEASGQIREDNLLSYAKTGVNGISMGMITHSVPSADISLRYKGPVAKL